MRICTIAGGGSERGMDYGREQAKEIADAAAALKSHLAAGAHPPGPIARHIASSPLVQAAADLVPDLWAEVVATASGSRVSLEDLLLLVFLDESWGLTRQSGCSAIARIVAGSPGIPPVPATTEIGQTMDLPAWTSGRTLVLRTGGGGAPNALTLAYPGAIGLCGANELGLGVAVNALPHTPMSEEGLGVAFITRHLLTLSSLADAESFLQSVPHACGQAYTVAAPDGMATFEADPAAVRRVTAPGVAAIAQTNHRSDDDSASESSRQRLDLLLAGLERREPFSETLTGDVVVDGEKWRDSHHTFGAFRAVGSEPYVRFIDGDAVRAGDREWSRFGYR